jgi:CelD/BcsL family acetyltransferase involved in cellulose biosynthesis
VSAVKVVTYASVASLPQHWRDLFQAREANQQFDQTLSWFTAFEAHALPGDERVQFVCAEGKDGAPIACLPLRRRVSSAGLPTGHAHSLASYYTSLFAPVVAANAAAVRPALAAIARVCDVVRIEPLATEDPLTGEVEAALRSGGFVTQRYFKFGNWYLEVAGRTYDQYFGSLSSQVRNTVVRKEKKFRADKTTRVEIVTDPADLPRAIAAYENVYASSWKTAEPFPHFVPEMMKAMASRGWLRLGVAWLGEEPIASQIWITKDGVASIFKLAYKEQHAKLSAGSILTSTLMRHALDVDHVTIVDYLTGDDSYKKDWMSARRERIGIVAASTRSLTGLAYAARHLLPGEIKRRFRVTPLSP